MTDPAWKKHLAKGKPKTAIYRLRGCGGCDDAIMDLDETLLKYADLAEIVLWPMAMECDTSRIQQMKDGEIALSIIHGTVRNPGTKRRQGCSGRNRSSSWPSAHAPASEGWRGSPTCGRERTC